jgi:2-iminobutanoate/2-iminopropanoate deaminase
MAISMVNTDKAPRAIGPYSQAVRAGDLLFCSGQIPMDPAGGSLELFGGDVGRQAKLVMENLKAVLAAEGLSFDDVVKTTIYLDDMENFAKVNEVYGSCFSSHRPARATVEVARLPKGVGVEIDAIASY